MQVDSTTTFTHQYLTFYCGPLLIAMALSDVKEINRASNFHDVPETPPVIRGVLNLRGDVVTMINLHAVFRQQSRTNRRPHNIFVQRGNEIVGLVTDGVADIISIANDQIDPIPGNVDGLDAAVFKQVHTTPKGRLVLLLKLSDLLTLLQ